MRLRATEPGDLLGCEQPSRYGTPERSPRVEYLQVAFHVGNCVWGLTAILSPESEVNQCANTIQRTLEIMRVRTVTILQCRRQYSCNTTCEIADLGSWLSGDFAIGHFWYTESGVRRNFLPSIDKRMLPFVVFQEFPHIVSYG